MGGTFAYLAAERLNIDAAAAYYGTRLHHYLEAAANVAYPLLLHFGELDHTTPPDVLAAIADAVAPNDHIRLEVYQGASHRFVNPARPSHHKDATALAHARTMAFFREALDA
jgi:carboxymethylenebutenolidase